MSDINIKELREKFGYSQEKLAEIIGVHTRTVQNWEAGGNIPNAKHALLRRMMDEAVLKISPKYAGGEQQKGEKLIPFYDDVSSIGGNKDQTANMEGISQPTEYINTGDWFRDATAAIRHYGDSMTEYPSGCILALKEVNDRELIIPGYDYMIETAEYRVTKRIQKGRDSEHITAYSTNTETYPDGRQIHEPFDIPWRSITHIALVLGYVVKKSGGVMVFNNKL